MAKWKVSWQSLVCENAYGFSVVEAETSWEAVDIVIGMHGLHPQNNSFTPIEIEPIKHP